MGAFEGASRKHACSDVQQYPCDSCPADTTTNHAAAVIPLLEVPSELPVTEA